MIGVKHTQIRVKLFSRQVQVTGNTILLLMPKPVWYQLAIL